MEIISSELLHYLIVKSNLPSMVKEWVPEILHDSFMKVDLASKDDLLRLWDFRYHIALSKYGFSPVGMKEGLQNLKEFTRQEFLYGNIEIKNLQKGYVFGISPEKDRALFLFQSHG